jgi:hypothetical protein
MSRSKHPRFLHFHWLLSNLVGKKESTDLLARAKQVVAKAQAHAKSQFLTQAK